MAPRSPRRGQPGSTLNPGEIRCNTCLLVQPDTNATCTNCGRVPTDPKDTDYKPYAGWLRIGKIFIFTVIVIAVAAVAIFLAVRYWNTHNDGTPAAPLASDPTAVLTTPAPIVLTPATSVPTFVPPPTTAPNPTALPTAAPTSKGILLIDYGLVSTDQLKLIKQAFPGWKVSTIGSQRDIIPLYKALTDLANNYDPARDGKVVIVTHGLDASPNDYNADQTVVAINGKGFNFVLLTSQSDGSTDIMALVTSHSHSPSFPVGDATQLISTVQALMQ